MFRVPFIRSMALTLALLGAALVPMLSHGSQAAGTKGTIAIHSRACEVDSVDLYADCHGNPGPTGAVYTVGKRTPKAISSTGLVSFGGEAPGDHLVTLTSGFDSGAYSSMRVFCTNSKNGGGPNEATVLYSETPQFWVRLGAGSRLTCDVYFIP
jgi:hypothetical protein